MTEHEQLAADTLPLDARIPVLNTPATTDEIEAVARLGEGPQGPAVPDFTGGPESPSVCLDNEQIAALADQVLDRMAPVLHDALVEAMSEYLSERDVRRD